MSKNALRGTMTDGATLAIAITVIFAGIHGLISILFLMSISRLDLGRDPEIKHGVSSGASRLGGLAILFSLISGVILSHYLNGTLTLENISIYIDDILIFSFIIGLIGLVEDLFQSLSSIVRFTLIIAVVTSSLISMHEALPYELIIFNSFDGVSKPIIVYLFTIIMVSGFINAGNIADGANGLLSLVCIVFFVCAHSFEPSIFYLSLIVSLLIFCIYNISTGRIFLGDFGAYFLSAIVAYSSIEIYSKHDVSVFLFASILIYPCFEISRSLIARSFRKKSLMSPDNYHLHNYVNSYFLSHGLAANRSNSMTGLIIASLTSGPPIYLFLNGLSPIDDVWFFLFIVEYLSLCVIYSLFSKISIKKY